MLAFSGAVMVVLSNIGMMMIKRMQERMGDNLPPDFEAWKRNFEQNARRNSFGSRGFDPTPSEEPEDIEAEPEEEPEEEIEEEIEEETEEPREPEETKEEADGDEPRDDL